MTLNELLDHYHNREEAALVWATQENITIEEARFVIRLGLGKTDGDVARQTQSGLVPLFPLNKETKQ